MVVIEMNPRVSRSQRARVQGDRASRSPRSPPSSPSATRLDEIPQRHHRRDAGAASSRPSTTSSPRSRAGRSRSCPARRRVLGTQMQSVGEVMAIGRTFPESLQKALRSLETRPARAQLRPGRARARRRSADDELVRAAAIATPDRLFQLEAALRRGVVDRAPARGDRRRPVVPRPDRCRSSRSATRLGRASASTA